jgi:adenylate cyclase
MLARGFGVRQLRIVCGLVLFSYLLTHFINHALGNISLEAMEYGLWFHVTWWQSPLGTLLLYGALAVHGSLGLWALYQRRFFRWKTAEITQLVLGLSIPPLLCTHLIGERLASRCTDFTAATRRRSTTCGWRGPISAPCRQRSSASPGFTAASDFSSGCV